VKPSTSYSILRSALLFGKKTFRNFDSTSISAYRWA
jgi:hypothetical protein